MSQFWADIAFLHWRVDPEVLRPFMPPGAQPDIYEGSAWVGLLPFRMQRAGLGPGPAIPYLGTFWETNVRIYSTDDRGRPGVVFLSLEAERLAVVLGARIVFNVPYFWARMSGHADDPAPAGQVARTYRSRRLSPGRGRPASQIALEVGEEIARPGPLELFLSARFGLHTGLAGRGVWVPNTHRPWPLRTARVLRLADELVAATGLPDLPSQRPPDHVMFSSGVHTRFGMPVLT